MRRLEATPERMVERNGQVNFGTFHVPFHNANVIDAPLYAAGAPRFWKKFRLKEWQHFGIITSNYYFGMVIFDAKFMGVSFFYAYDRNENKRFEHSVQLPGGAANVAAQVYDGHCEFKKKGYRLYIENRLPDYKVFSDTKAKVTIGTDSLTSNWQLSVWEEIRTIRRYQSYVPLETLLTWATINGAEALGYEDRLGSITIGKTPGLVLVEGQDMLNHNNRISRLI